MGYENVAAIMPGTEDVPDKKTLAAKLISERTDPSSSEAHRLLANASDDALDGILNGSIDLRSFNGITFQRFGEEVFQLALKRYRTPRERDDPRFFDYLLKANEELYPESETGILEASSQQFPNPAYIAPD